MSTPEELETSSEKITVLVIAEQNENPDDDQSFELTMTESSITLLEKNGTTEFFKNFRRTDELDDAIAHISRSIKRPPVRIIGCVEFPTVRLFTNDNTVFTPKKLLYSVTKAFLAGEVLIGAADGELKSEPPFRIEIEELPRLRPFRRMMALSNQVAKAIAVDVPTSINLHLQPIGSVSNPCFKVTDE
jgi:hypothetical protein